MDINYTINEEEILVFPNPAAGHITIQGGRWDIKNIDLYNTNGKLINSRKINTKFYQLNMSGLIGGRFILIVKTENTRIRRDVIKLQSATEFTFLANTYFYSYFVFLNNIHE